MWNFFQGYIIKKRCMTGYGVTDRSSGGPLERKCVKEKNKIGR